MEVRASRNKEQDLERCALSWAPNFDTKSALQPGEERRVSATRHKVQGCLFLDRPERCCPKARRYKYKEATYEVCAIARAT